MKPSEALKKVPKDGFLKLTLERAELAPNARSALIRKGNELLNQGKHGLALRIFMTTGYLDGLVRLGEVYEKEGKPLEAFRMYWLARYRKKIDPSVEKMAGVVRQWLGQPDGAPARPEANLDREVTE
jgi:hypothetical protein